MFQKQIIDKLQAARRERFSEYDRITLNKAAVKIFARLFVNPDCQTDIDLFALDKEKVKLSYLGDHIITAGPSTVAQYCEKHKITKVTDKELLKCFALDHAHDVHENKVADKKSAHYAYAHILLTSTIDELIALEGNTIAHVSSKTSWGTITFKNVMVPHDLIVKKGQNVYHHFGVIVALADDQKFSDLLYALQSKHEFIVQLGRVGAQKNITIDFSDTHMFHKDVLGQILKPHKVSPVHNPGDLQKGKVTFKN